MVGWPEAVGDVFPQLHAAANYNGAWTNPREYLTQYNVIILLLYSTYTHLTGYVTRTRKREYRIFRCM